MKHTSRKDKEIGDAENLNTCFHRKYVWNVYLKLFYKSLICRKRRLCRNTLAVEVVNFKYLDVPKVEVMLIETSVVQYIASMSRLTSLSKLRREIRDGVIN